MKSDNAQLTLITDCIQRVPTKVYIPSPNTQQNKSFNENPKHVHFNTEWDNLLCKNNSFNFNPVLGEATPTNF